MRAWGVIFKKYVEFELDMVLRYLFNLDAAHLPVLCDSRQLSVAQQLQIRY